jgi:hypothetical protein
VVVVEAPPQPAIASKAIIARKAIAHRNFLFNIVLSPPLNKTLFEFILAIFLYYPVLQ